MGRCKRWACASSSENISLFIHCCPIVVTLCRLQHLLYKLGGELMSKPAYNTLTLGALYRTSCRNSCSNYLTSSG
jgi:hypothetical protein